MDIFKTARFYQIASDEEIERFEEALDEGDYKTALAVVHSFHDLGYPTKPFDLEAKREPDFLELPPEVGDMVLIVNTNHYARLLAISDDRELVLVKEEWGAYPTKFENIRRIR